MNRLSLLALAALIAAGCSSSTGVKSSSSGVSAGATSTPASTSSGATAPETTAAPRPKVHRLASGLVYEDLAVGNGKMADPGLTVAVHYTGWLTDGTKFASSYDSGKPFTFTIGDADVIQGWNEGVKGMRIGGRRRLTIPPDLAYGARGRDNVIPPNATLVFEIELLGVH